MKYYVISRFYDNGHVTGSLVHGKDYAGQQDESTCEYDQYVNCFNSLGEAVLKVSMIRNRFAA